MNRAAAEDPGDDSVHGARGGSADLLATKFFVPRPPADLVPRPRLVALLDEGLRADLTVVIGPAGFGKTALLAAWSARRETPVGWLSLDPGDNDPVRFWRHVVHALDQVGIRVAERVEPLLAASDPPFDGVVTAVLGAVAAAQADVVLVLDDYHVIETARVHDSLLLLLENAPPALSVVLAGRADPPIPLARLRARGRLAEVRVGDLRFTFDEAARLLRGLVGSRTPLPDDAVAALAERTEGWAAGLQLAALSLHGRADVSDMVGSFSGSHRFILDYLTEEVLAHQPKQIQHFLLETSVLDKLSGPLCDAVTGRAGGQEMLEAIERASLFLVPLDDVRGWWRYHHLFADLLRARLKHQRPGWVPELHRRAAGWHVAYGSLDEAVTHALAADDGALAAGLVERHADELLMRGEGATLQRWLKVLPAGTTASQPRLLLTQARLAAIAGQVDTAELLLDAVEHAYPGSASTPYEPSVGRSAGPLANVPAIVAINRAFIANQRGDADDAVRFATEALDHIRDDEWMLDSLARLHIAVARWMHGDPAAAEPEMDSLLERWFAFGALDYAVLWSSVLGQVQAARGRLEAATRTYRRALDTDPPGRPQRTAAGAVLVGMAELAYQRDELDAARGHLGAALPLCRDLGFRPPLATGLALQASIHQAAGDVTAAENAIAEAGRRTPAAVVDLHNPAVAIRARLLLRRGEVDSVARWLDGRGLDVSGDLDYPREPSYLIKARVLMRQNQPGDALWLLDRLHTAAVGQGRVGSVIEIQVLRALAQAGRDDKRAATALAEALALAHPEGHVRVFTDEGRPMAALLGRLAAAAALPKEVPTDYLRLLTRAIDRLNPRTAVSSERMPAVMIRLSARELDVLRLLALGKANREIAGDLFISPHTVKRHVANILDKLGAANRTEAGVRARDLGLLD